MVFYYEQNLKLVADTAGKGRELADAIEQLRLMVRLPVIMKISYSYMMNLGTRAPGKSEG